MGIEIIGIVTATFLSIVAIILNYYQYKRNLKNKYEIEKLKGSLNEKLIVRKKQFEREFQCYQELWPVLVQLKNMFRSALSSEYEGERSGIIEYSYETIDKLSETLAVNQPFLKKDIYVELVSLHEMLQNKSQVYHGKKEVSINEFNDEVSEIQTLIDKACSKIHERLIIEEY